MKIVLADTKDICGRPDETVELCGELTDKSIIQLMKFFPHCKGLLISDSAFNLEGVLEKLIKQNPRIEHIIVCGQPYEAFADIRRNVLYRNKLHKKNPPFCTQGRIRLLNKIGALENPELLDNYIEQSSFTDNMANELRNLLGYLIQKQVAHGNFYKLNGNQKNMLRAKWCCCKVFN